MPDYCLLGQHCYCGIGLRCLNFIGTSRRMAHGEYAGEGHIGAPLSCIEAIARAAYHVPEVPQCHTAGSVQHPGKEPDYYEAYMDMPMNRAGGQTYIAALEQLDWLYFGMAVRTRTGVWNLPLCHDSYDEGNG